MKPAAFEMQRPSSLQDAMRLLAGAPEAKLLAGGQSLGPAMNFRLASPALVIDLARVEGLAGIRHERGHLHIGAMTRQMHLLESPLVARHTPLLAQALPHIGHVQTRSRGTIGGSLCHADPSAELPLVMVALDAQLTLRRVDATRVVPARAFFQGAMATTLAVDEVLTEIAIPAAAPGTASAFRELSRRRGDFAIVAVAAERVDEHWRVAIGGLEPTPRPCARLVHHLRGGGDVADAIEAELEGTDPMQDTQVSASYRRQLARVLLTDCLTTLMAA